MKSSVFFVAITAGMTLAAQVLIKPETKGARSIEGASYSCRIDARGFVKSLALEGTEFFALPGKTPGGFYLCGKGFRKVTDIETNDNTLSGTWEQGTITWNFLPDRIRCSISNSGEKHATFYGIVSPDIKQASTGRAQRKELPCKASGAKTLFLTPDGKALLEVRGMSRLWGPWKDHQVWEGILRKGKTSVFEFIPRKMTAADKAWLEPLPTISFDVAGTYTKPAQTPICMIGDSITWAGYGDWWRKHLLTHIPTLAFVGTHTAMHGYSHAGEGGNSVDRVIARMKDIPDCPNYNLLIGTNNNSVKSADAIEPTAASTAKKIDRAVNMLLATPSAKRVFLSSILPCYTKNPLRDKTNAATNVILRQRLKDGAFPEDKVIWVEYEFPIRAIDGWEPLIKLHPVPDGYDIIARIMADKIRTTLGLPEDITPPVAKPACGVRIWNLWDDECRRRSKSARMMSGSASISPSSPKPRATATRAPSSRSRRETAKSATSNPRRCARRRRLRSTAMGSSWIPRPRPPLANSWNGGNR